MTLLNPRSVSMQALRPTQFQTLTVASLVLTGICVLWAFVDYRSVDGAFVWMKPLKFSVSFALLFATITLVEFRMSASLRGGWLLRLTAWVMAAAFLSEMAYIIFQAAQAEPSHFNMKTPFNEFMYTAVMATGAVALVASVGFIGWLVKRDRDAVLSPVLRESIWLGFLLSFVITMIVASYLSSQQSHFVGIHPEGSPTLPVLGWSGVTGDLRPAHFFSLHAMQMIPVLGLVLENRANANSIWVVRIASLGYAGLTMGVFALGVAGIPFIPLG